MRDFTVDPAEFDAAGAALSDGADSISGLSLETPDNSMYGPLVGNAVDDAEPAATVDMNLLLSRVSWMVGQHADRTKDTGRRYAEAEQGNAGLSRGITGAVRGTGASS